MWYLILGGILGAIVLIAVRKNIKEQKAFDNRVELALESHFGVNLFTKDNLEDRQTFDLLSQALNDGRNKNIPIYQVATTCMCALILHDIRHMPLERLNSFDRTFSLFQDQIKQLEDAQFIPQGILELTRKNAIPLFLEEINKRIPKPLNPTQ